MNEIDDRLAGDPVWELFGDPTRGPARGVSRIRVYLPWLVVAGSIAVAWMLVPSLAAAIACLAVGARDFRRGRRLARSLPDKAGGAICARFTHAWGAWKVAATALALAVALAAVYRPVRDGHEPPSALATLMLICLAGYALSAALTASGLFLAYRSGMRVWVGEGVNRARTLLLGMLIGAFTIGVLGPICVGLSTSFPARAAERETRAGLAFLLMLYGCVLGGPVGILIILDRLGRRVIADRPGKFGPKVPAVGKWDR
jgi:hypothetical protein